MLYENYMKNIMYCRLQCYITNIYQLYKGNYSFKKKYIFSRENYLQLILGHHSKFIAQFTDYNYNAFYPT